MNNCVFCKIAKNQIPCHKLFEDEFCIAFLDISQEGKGHTLVIPKKHYDNILDCDDFSLSQIVLVVKKISRHFVENCGFDGVNVLINNGECAGQSVFHLHFHIIPRLKDDNIENWKIKKQNENLQELAKKFEVID